MVALLPLRSVANFLFEKSSTSATVGPFGACVTTSRTGAGGGGLGSTTNNANHATVGAVNTDGGGGGGQSTTYIAREGGSGVVVLRMLDTDYSGTVTGSPTVATDGLYKVITFTGTGTYTT